MMSFFEWYDSNAAPDQPWLILGKGPSFSKKAHFQLSGYRLLSLNDAARELRVDVAHAIDLQVIERSGDAIAVNARVLAMPWRPHVDFRPGPLTLADHARTNPVLAKLAAEGRLVWYNLSTTTDHRPNSPVVTARYFSAEAALNLLAIAGARMVRSLGIDGGTGYSLSFKDLDGRSLLANRRASFDVQFAEIAKTLLHTGVDFAPLDTESPARIYVATTEAQMLAVRVLEYSIRKHASMTTRIYPLHLSGIDIPTPKDPRNWPRTPFSFQRYVIPELAGRRGRAIYLDSDMQVFRDIRELWSIPFAGADILAVGDTGNTGRRPQFSVMVLDCAALEWNIRDLVDRLDAGDLVYEDLVYDMSVAKSIRADIPGRWNSLETYREGETALLHYTDMRTQPWVYAAHPYSHLWVQDLLEAIDLGFIKRREVAEHVERGWIRPSLMWQIENRQIDGVLLPKSVRKLDRQFRPPYMGMYQHDGSPWKQKHNLVKAIAASLYRRTGMATFQRRVLARVKRR
jgi:hypothetical protein